MSRLHMMHIEDEPSSKKGTHVAKGGIQHQLIPDTNELLTSLQDNTCWKRVSVR